MKEKREGEMLLCSKRRKWGEGKKWKGKKKVCQEGKIGKKVNGRVEYM